MSVFFKNSSDTISGLGTVRINIKTESVVIEGLYDGYLDKKIGFVKPYDVNFLPLRIIVTDLIEENDINLEYLRGNHWSEFIQDELYP